MLCYFYPSFVCPALFVGGLTSNDDLMLRWKSLRVKSGAPSVSKIESREYY